MDPWCWRWRSPVDLGTQFGIRCTTRLNIWSKTFQLRLWARLSAIAILRRRKDQRSDLIIILLIVSFSTPSLSGGLSLESEGGTKSHQVSRTLLSILTNLRMVWSLPQISTSSIPIPLNKMHTCYSFVYYQFLLRYNYCGRTLLSILADLNNAVVWMVLLIPSLLVSLVIPWWL